MNRTLYYYLFGKFRSRLTSAENAIANKISADDLDTAIAGKADANDVSDLADRVTSAENAITEKADASDLSTLAGRVTQAETAISGKAAASDLSDLADRVSTAETAIAGKAAAADVSTLAGRVSDAETAISGKASSSDLSTLAGRVTDAETALSGKASASDLSTLAGRVSDAEGTIAEHTTAIAGKAAASDLSTLAGRVSDAETAISGKASATDVTALAGRVSDAETAISGKASASDLSTLAGRVTTAEGTLSEHTTAISGKAAASDVTALAGRVSDAETAISGKASIASVTELAGKVSDAAGPGHVLGGYTAKIISYEETTANDVTTYSLYLDHDLNDEVDYTKFSAGDTIRISLIESDAFITAEIATVDQANGRLTLTESIYGTQITSSTTIGMEKKAVSGYTASATGGPSVYRVTYSGAGTAEELFEGRTIYTRAGSGAFVSNSIAGTSGNYIYLTSAAAGTNAIYLAPAMAFLVVDDETAEISHALGEYNIVSGEASLAAGAFNRVTGIGNSAVGSANTVIGDNNYIMGEGNLALGFSISVTGNNNEIYDGNVFVTGNQNKAYKQGAVLIGDMNVALAVNTYAFGWGNQLKAHGVMGVGTRNTISGKWSVAVGYSNKVAAETAYVVGRYADVPDAAENKNAFIIWGGEHQNNAEAFAVRSFRAEENPLFNSASLAPGSSLSDPNPKDSAGERKYNSVPAYRTEYKGQLKPTTQTIAVSGAMTLTLDPTMYSRVMLTGSGTVTFDIEDYAEDGDRIELVIDTSAVTPVFPAGWVIDNSVYSLWTVSPGVYCMVLRKEGGTIYVRDAFHVSTAEQLEELIQSGVSLQFSADGDNWHNDQRAGDAYVRFKLAAGGVWTTAIEMPKITSISLAACSGLGEYLSDNAFTMTWIDPDNVTLNGATLAEWNQTVLVRKVGSYPADHTDGTILATTSRTLGNKNAYRSTGYTDSDRTEGTTYFYKLFSQTTAGVWNNLTGNQFAESTSMSWGMVQAFVRAGRGAELFPVGTVFEVDHPEYTVDGHGIYFRVSGHDQVPAADETLTHSMCLEMVDVIFSAPYDNPEYLYALTEDTTAQAGKTYYTYANGTYSAIAEGTDYDVGDPVPEGSWYEKNINSSRATNGSNNPVHSNLIQWANSGGAANQWFEKQTLWDTCNTTLAEKNGFCRNIDPEFLAVVKLANLYSRTCDAEGYLLVAHNAKFWPLSRTQIVNSSGSENEFLAFYANGGSAKKMLAGTSTYRSWATRSVYKDNTFTVLRVLENGTSANNSYLDAVGSGGISLACIIA